MECDIEAILTSDPCIGENDLREFGLRGPNNTYIYKQLNVVWNTDTLKNMPSVVSYGQLFIADVVFLTKRKDWIYRPAPQDLIYSPRNIQWEVMVCQEFQRVAYIVHLRQKTGK